MFHHSAFQRTTTLSTRSCRRRCATHRGRYRHGSGAARDRTGANLLQIGGHPVSSERTAKYDPIIRNRRGSRYSPRQQITTLEQIDIPDRQGSTSVPIERGPAKIVIMSNKLGNYCRDAQLHRLVPQTAESPGREVPPARWAGEATVSRGAVPARAARRRC